jgi:2,3-bisphosphoglycerate-independent phosphoglycerate mutase
MKVLFLFLDGVGLGEDDPQINPFARVDMPHLEGLLGNKKLINKSLSENFSGSKLENGRLESERATLIAMDATLGVDGLPQSATGQAVLLTGINIPAKLGYHYGPKPNAQVAEFLKNGNLFSTLSQNGYRSGLLNAYPPGYFAAIRSGRRLYSAIPLAVTSAGLPLLTDHDLRQGNALSADFTARGWRERLDLPDTPVISPRQAGERLARLAGGYELAFFEYWLSDYAGHSQDIRAASSLLLDFDQVLGGLLQNWKDEDGLILITSDHGNLEDLGTRRHTAHPVPGLVIGGEKLRREFTENLNDLTGVTPAILKTLGLNSNKS